MDAFAFDLRKPEEVKEYMKNLRIEYQYQCYKEELSDGCHRLADFYEAFKKDLAKARSIYKHTCDTYKYAFSCYKHANYSMLGKAGQKDIDIAMADYKTGCDGGHGPSCYRAGLLLQSTDVETKDFVASKVFLEQGCGVNHVESCNHLGTFYLSGKPGIPQDYKKALELMKKCCDVGHMYACANLSMMYKNGDGVERDMKMCEHYKKIAKELHSSATKTERSIDFGK